VTVTLEGHRSKVGRLAPLILHVGTGRKLNGQLHLPATLLQENIFPVHIEWEAEWAPGPVWTLRIIMFIVFTGHN